MGLDMYLTGEKYLWIDFDNPDNTPTEDGYRLKTRTVELGYWRKHANLHGFIVKEFADGKDDCQEIDLSKVDLWTILAAVKNDQLPHTEGFFFGSSGDPKSEDREEREWYQRVKGETIETLEKAIAWMEVEEPRVSRSASYRASW